jgi:hypothetical protein
MTETGDPRTARLEILIENHDLDLANLWWEMMFLGSVPLAVRRKLRCFRGTRVIG